jgi:type II secretion system protein C
LTSQAARQKTIFRLALLTSAGILALVSYQSIDHLLSPVQPSSDPIIPSLQSRAQPKPKPTNTLTYKQISNWHLFGMATRKELAGNQPINAPETNLNLSLLGILFDPDQKESRAIIAEEGKPHKSYKVGDPLPRNATLHSIEEERVLLSRNGRHESLKLKKLKLPEDKDIGDSNNQRAAKNLRTQAEQQPGKTVPAGQTSGKVKPKNALGELSAPKSGSQMSQARGQPQDV